jgi:hypothetical protein
MTIEVVLTIRFPRIEFRKIPTAFLKDTSLQYKNGNGLFYLGEIISLEKENEGLLSELEVRHDETPVWYVRSIIETAHNKEIVFVEGSRVLCSGGNIEKTSLSPNAVDTEIVYPFVALILPQS